MLDKDLPFGIPIYVNVKIQTARYGHTRFLENHEIIGVFAYS